MNQALLPPKNQTLLKEKISLLENQNFTSDYQTHFSFHGINLSFHTSSKILHKELKDYIPSSWKRDGPQEKTVFHCPVPSKYKENFEDEASSIVESLDSKEASIAIQRDFVAKQDHLQRCYTIFEENLDDGFHNFFRWYLSPKLLSFNKAMIHSSIVLDNEEKANVFLGPSGAGKTTVTSLSQPRKVLSDDMNLLQIEEGKLYALAGGVGGLYKPDVDFDQKFEVKNLFWLVQAPENRILSQSPIEQNRHILSSLANLPWTSSTKEENQKILALCHNILALKPLKSLFFQKNSDFWTLID